MTNHAAASRSAENPSCGLHGTIAAGHSLGDNELRARDFPAATCRGREWHSSETGFDFLAPPRAARTLKGLGIRVTQGVVTGANPVFLLHVVYQGQSGLTRVQDREGRQHLIESALLKPAVRSREVHAFSTPVGKSHLLIPYDDCGKLLGEQDLAARFPAAHRYLSKQIKQMPTIPLTARRTRPFFAFRNDAVLRLPPGPHLLIGMATSGADAAIAWDGTVVAHAGVFVLDNVPAGLDPSTFCGRPERPGVLVVRPGYDADLGRGAACASSRPARRIPRTHPAGDHTIRDRRAGPGDAVSLDRG